MKIKDLKQESPYFIKIEAFNKSKKSKSYLDHRHHLNGSLSLPSFFPAKQQI